MTEFELDGKKYKCGALDAFKQSFIVKRLAPALTSLAPALKTFQSDKTAGVVMFGEAIGKLSDDDLEFIQKTCLSVVVRFDGASGRWVHVLPKGGALAFEDIDLLVLNEIVFAVLADNLASFFSGLTRRGWVSEEPLHSPQ